MAIYKFPICGYEYDEEKTGVKFEDLPESYRKPIVIYLCFIHSFYKLTTSYSAIPTKVMVNRR